MKICPECHATYPDGASTCTEDASPLVPADALPTGDAALEPGTMVGEYRVDQKLGAGTFGDVYAGEQPLIGKRVAVKVLRQRFSADTQIVSRFVSEARAVNRIRHRNIIDIFSFGKLPDGRHYFVMELLEGLTLGDLLRRERRLAVPDALRILEGIADALDAAHQAGVTHRDLKPDNVFLAVEKDQRWFPKLLDFGVAKLVADDVAHKTATGVAIGTPRYMSPEQARGKQVDHRSDIYALGVVVHEMLTGQAIFDGDTAMDVLLKHMVDPPPTLSSVCGDLPSALDAPVLAMLAKRREARPDTAGAAIAALAAQARQHMDAATLTIRPAAARAPAPPSTDTAPMPGGHPPEDASPTVPQLLLNPAAADPSRPLATLRSGPELLTPSEALAATIWSPDNASGSVAAASAPIPAKLPPTLDGRASAAPPVAATTAGAPPSPVASTGTVQPAASRRPWVWAAVGVAGVAVAAIAFGRTGTKEPGPAPAASTVEARAPAPSAPLVTVTADPAPTAVEVATGDAGAPAPVATTARPPTNKGPAQGEKKGGPVQVSPDLDRPSEYKRPK